MEKIRVHSVKMVNSEPTMTASRENPTLRARWRWKRKHSDCDDLQLKQRLQSRKKMAHMVGRVLLAFQGMSI